MNRSLFPLEVRPRLPQALARLDELALNLAYAWEPRIRAVFARLDPETWAATGKTPRLMLRRVPQSILDRAAADEDFLADYRSACEALDSLLQAPRDPALAGQLGDGDLVAYFCAEFGLHESLPIYSGGLGVLAGDHLKAASDLGAPLVAVGLLYRQGYFTQTLDAHGRQHASAHESDFDERPVAPCRGGDGSELRVRLDAGERPLDLRLWEAQVGRIRLILLDSDLPENDPADRVITHQLYGGDGDLRIRQEIVLGVGGVRALRRLGLSPTVWHCNEGHAAFSMLERLRERVAVGEDFDTALEAVAAAQVFTTHTPVAAGHDVFPASQLRWHLRGLLPQLGASEERVLALGAAQPAADAHGHFNMTTLALRASRFHNGVSRLHGRVARRMERALWPQLRAQDVPIRHVTNGIHLPTFLAQEWQDLFDRELPGWQGQLLNPAFWTALDRIDDARFAELRRHVKRALLADAHHRLLAQLHRNRVPESIVTRATRVLAAGGDPLVLGFARRFATYKRATLLLSDEARLARLLNDPARPAVLLVAGKAHPRDQPGQALIQQLWQASLRPEFIGRLIVLEGYDLRLARHLVQGADVWLNTPEWPLEACGTSGMKAAINGSVNVSVLDGWWDEAWNGESDRRNGFAIRPADPAYWSGRAHHADEPHLRARDEEEACQLFDLLEHEVAPRYYGGVDGAPYGAEWLRIARQSMKDFIPRFNSARMVLDYAREFYAPAAAHGRALAPAESARALAQWKQRVRSAWGGVGLRALAPLPAVLDHGVPLELTVRARLNGLAAEDVAVECELGRLDGLRFTRQRIVRLDPRGGAQGEVEFGARIEPLAGRQHLRLRMRPEHAHLAHPFELGLVVWA